MSNSPSQDSKVTEENEENPILEGGLPNLDEEPPKKSIADLLGQLSEPAKSEEKPLEEHKFWKTQPVIKENLESSEKPLKEGPIEPNKKKVEISETAVPLPKELVWDTIDISDDQQLTELYELLSNHYVEDVHSTFRFDYSAAFLRWALQPPHMQKEWTVGIRTNDENRKLVGFIAGTPIELRVRTSMRPMIEINFLCIHKRLRALRLAPIIIKEVTRRAHLKGIFQAIYTGGIVLPTPISKCQYYHRTINAKKLVELGFCALPRNMTMTKFSQYYKTASHTSIPGLRPIRSEDIKQTSRLLRDYLSRYDLAPSLSVKDCQHMLVSGSSKPNQVTWTYVVEDPKSKQITDLFMFYELPSTAVKFGKTIRAAYLSYYATNVVLDTSRDSNQQPTPCVWASETPEQKAALKERLNELIADALVVAAQEGFDVMNALTILDNNLFLNDLLFGQGDGYLHYYLYNYVTKPIDGGINNPLGSGMGLVML